jgi:hypothetical protein
MSSGNGIVIASTVAMNLGLTWGGVKYSWSSYHVLVPLIIGIAGIGVFLVYEIRIPEKPIVPWRIWSNRTTGGGYVLTYFLVPPVGILTRIMYWGIVHSLAGVFLTGMGITMVVYGLPTYFQGSKGSSAVRSGILVFCTAACIGTCRERQDSAACVQRLAHSSLPPPPT